MTPDICVIGAGSAGLTVAAAAASFGQSVVLVERGRMGGDCLNYGCVPSKSLIAAAKHAHMARDGARFGITAEPKVDYRAVHDHVHGVIAAIAPHDSVERFEGLGVTVIKASGTFVGPDALEAGGHTIRARRFVIATGSSPLVPPIDGLGACEPLTNESVFDLTRLPERLAVIGGGPIGAELSQAFRRLGATVSIIEGETLLAREDADAVAVVRAAMTAEGVALVEGARVERCAMDGAERVLTLSDGRVVRADAVLVAAGRRANIAGLGLEAAGVAHDGGAITVDTSMRTSNRRIYAIGDVTGGLQFTHVAGHQASLAVRSIVFRLPVSYDPDLMPRCTYTAPELAQVGPTLAQAQAADPGASAVTAPLSGNDRARAEGETDGFVRLVLDRGGRLLGATIVGPGAGDMIATYALALAGKVKLSTLAAFTPAYPTFAEAGKRAATMHFAQKLDKAWLRRVLGMLKRF